MLSNSIDVQLARNPFENERIHSYAIEGETIEQIIDSRGLRIDNAYGVIVVLGGETVPERMFPKVRPKAGTLIVIKVVPRGGSSGKAILSIVIGVLAIAAAVYTGGGSLAAFGALEGGAQIGVVSLAFTGAMAIGTGIQSLLAPAPSIPFGGNVPQSQDSAALVGTRNTARLYGPIRTVLGRYRVYPDLLGKPFPERVGKDSILRMLLCFGYGPMDITDIRIGETPIDELIDSSKYTVLKGFDDDDDLKIFRDEVDLDVSRQVKLDRKSPLVQVLTTKLGPEEISIDFAFPGGLVAFNDEGRPQKVTAQFTILQREAGVGEYVLIEDPTAGLESSTGFTQISPGVFQLKLKQRGSITRGLRWPVPDGSTAQVAHEIKITRNVLSDNDMSPGWNGKDVAINADAVITVIRTIKPHIGSLIPNLAKIELEINASDTGLSGIIDNLSAICTSIVPKYDTVEQSWGPATATSEAYGVSMFPSRNPAWLFANVLRGSANSRPIDDSRLDGPGLAIWAGNLGGTGNYDIGGTEDIEGVPTGVPRNIDAVVDFTTTARKLISDIAATGRASLNIIDGKYSVVQDIPQTQVVQHFTPRNSSGFSGSKAFRKAPHAIRVHFVNPEPRENNKSYQKDELIVYNDNYSEEGNYAVRLKFKGSTTPTTLLDGGPGASNSWVPSAFSDLVGYRGYAMRHTVTGSAPHFQNQTNNLLAIDADESKFVRVRMRRVTAGNEDWYGKLNFRTGASSFSDSIKEVQNTEPDWTKGWITVVWDLSDNANWTGTIDRLRFSFTQNGSDFPGSVFDIDSISVDDNTQSATEFAELSLWGVSDAKQAYRDGRYHLASTKLRPEIFTISVDVEQLVCNRGDLVRVSHDVIGIGYGAARFTDVTTESSEFTEGILDEEFHYEAGKNYAIRIRGMNSSGTLSADAIIDIVNKSDAFGGVSSMVIPDEAYSFVAAGTVKPRVGDLVLFGERETESIECIVKKISPRNDLTAIIELVEYNKLVYETGPIPEHDSKITLEGSPTLILPVAPDIVGELISDESAAEFSSSGTPTIRIILNVSTPYVAERAGIYAPTTHYHSQFRVRDDEDATALTDWINAPRVEAMGETEVSIRPVEQGEVYDIRVRAISDSAATASNWVYRNNYTVIGLSTPPDPPTELSVWGDAIRWSYGNKPRDFAGFIVKHQAGSDATWSTGIVLSENLITDNWVHIGGRVQPGNTTLMVRAVDVVGNESTTLSAVKLIASPDDLDIVSSATWTGTWVGGRGNCSIEPGTLHLIADINESPLFWPGSDASTYWAGDDDIDFWGLTIYDEMTFTGTHTLFHDPDEVLTGGGLFDLDWPDDAHIPARQRFSEFEAEGADFKIEYRAIKTYNPLTNPQYTYYQDWTPWPGERTMHEIEFPWLLGVLETISFRITISSGTTQGKLKAAKIIIEGLFKMHRETVDVSSTGGTVIDLTSATTGKLWRKITSATVTPMQDTNASQGGITGEMYNLLAKHEPGGTGTGAWELSGPKIRLWTADGAGTIETTGNAVVVIEGY